MGFYGNITSTNKTQFTFDKIYPNRKTMDRALEIHATEGDTSAPGDGVFIGRFVLVDYEDGKTGYFPIFKKDDSGIFYADSSFKTIMTTALCKANDIFQYQAGSILEFWQATGNSASTTIDEETVEYATFIQVTNSKYEANYKVDTAPIPEGYGPGRGYDGTVWQKVFAEGKEKYVMVAELNSVVPTFKVTADAPTMNPLPPHFDKQSNNVAYWLHVQPQWGMRVKQAEPLKDANQQVITDKDGNPIIYSDTEVTWVETPYDEVTNELKEPIKTQVPGNIYFNKAGLSKEIRTYNQMDDVVSIAPTGTSGYLYPGHTVEPKEANDIQEISIILPSIGNAISDAWDVVYGVPKTADNKRNLDIDWDSLKGIRMVEDGTSGYKYNSKNANSLAGCINSVHDLMGMIIMEESVEDPKDADANSIYYNSTTGKFERKHTTYTYKEVRSISDENTFEEVPGINLLKWAPGEYHYKDSLKNYFADESEKPDLSRNYYKPNFEEQLLTPKYLPNTWWLKEENNYIKAKSQEETIDAIYYDIDEGTIITAYWYAKGRYLYKKKEDDPYYLVTSEDKLNPEYIYYRLRKNGTYQYYQIEDLEEKEISYEAEPGKYVTIKTKVIPDDAVYENCNALLVQFEQNKYYKKDYDGPNYSLLTSIPMNDNDGVWSYVYAIKATAIPPFYTPDTYYFKSNKDYLKDRAGEYNEEKAYYKLIAENKIEQKFYVEGEYYEQVNGSYDPSEDIDPDSDKNYYEKKDYYVIIDDLGQLPTGAEWNPNIENWEETLHIGTREEKYEMQELPGFARSFNTIHGLILEIKKLLDTGHVYTRDENTVQGAINKLKDIIAKFEDLQPGKLILTDNYGRVHPTDTINNDWIEWDIDSNPVNPSIEVKHKKAFDTVTTVSQGNTNPKFGETITTPEVAIDANGHVSSVKNEDITLPKPSLTINGSGVLTSASLVEETGALTTNYTALTDVKLDGYGKTTATGDILATDSLEIGLSKLENAIAFTNDALEDVDAQLREDFAAEDAAIRSEFAAADTAIRTDFAAADTTLQNNIDSVNTSLGNRITTIENKNDFGVGALTTRVEVNENKLNGVDSVKNSLDALDSRIAVFEQGDSSTIGGVITQVNNLEQKTNARFDAVEQTVSNHAQESNGQIENINNILNQKVACSVRGLGESLAGPGTGYIVMFAEDWLVNTNNAFTKESGSDIVCPYTGIILVSGSIYFNSTTESSRGVYIMKNGEEIISSYGHVYKQQGAISSGTIIVPVNAGDKISLRARSTIEIPIIGDNAGTNLSIMYL